MTIEITINNDSFSECVNRKHIIECVFNSIIKNETHAIENGGVLIDANGDTYGKIENE